MTSIIDGQSVEEDTYWHAMPNGLTGMFCWNTRLKKGFVPSTSIVEQGLPHGMIINPNMWLANASSPEWKDREQVWEAIRCAEFGDRPSRVGAWYLFDERDLVDTAKTKFGWFEGREVFEARIISGAAVFRADMKLVGGDRNDWEERAREYWSGNLGDDAFPELIVQGVLYFPEWDTKKFYRKMTD